MQQGRVSWKINFDDIRKVWKANAKLEYNRYIYQIRGAEHDGDKIGSIFASILKIVIFGVFTVENYSRKKICAGVFFSQKIQK